MIRFIIIFIFIGCNLHAQQKLHVKREDNRFLFYQLTTKQNDTIVAKTNDLFYMKLPDSLQTSLNIFVDNGLFHQVYKDSLIYQLQYVSGMKYLHQRKDTVFTTLLEGTCHSSKQITVSIFNTLKQKEVFRNLFWVR